LKVTVFGATGQIGRLVVFELLADGHDVNAIAIPASCRTSIRASQS
jgi:nucleoside-diphosphate-sugar epimerase